MLIGEVPMKHRNTMVSLDSRMVKGINCISTKKQTVHHWFSSFHKWPWTLSEIMYRKYAQGVLFKAWTLVENLVILEKKYFYASSKNKQGHTALEAC